MSVLEPTSDRRVSAKATTLVFNTYGGPFLQHILGDRGEHVVVHPTIPLSPFRFMKYRGDLYIAGTPPSRFDGRNFMGVMLYPPPFKVSSGSIVGDNLILCGLDVIHVYSLRTGEMIKSFYDYSILTYFEPVSGGYVGGCTRVVAHVDTAFNVLNVFPVKGYFVHYAVYDGGYYYTSEDAKYVRKYDSSGNLIAEKFMYYVSSLTRLSDGIYVVYDDGVAKLDSDLNVVDSIYMPHALLVCEVGDYLYISSAASMVYKVNKLTKEVEDTYSFSGSDIYSLRSTDDGNIIMSLYDWSVEKYFIKIFSPDMVELNSFSEDDVSFINGVYDAWKVPGENRVIASSPVWGVDFMFDMSTKEITATYTNFVVYDIDYNGKFYATALPLIGEVRIFDSDLNLVTSLYLYAPSSVRFYGDKLYVADYFANQVYVYDSSFNLLDFYDVSEIFTNYPIWTIGRVNGKWFLSDLYSKIVFFDDNFKPINSIPVSGLNDTIIDFAEYGGKYYVLGNHTSTVYQIDLNGNVIAKYSYPYAEADKVFPSHTGGIVFVGPNEYIRFFRDMQVEKVIPYVTRHFYRTPKGNYVASNYTSGPLSGVREYDLDGNLVRRVVISNVIAYQACILSDDNIVVGDIFSSEVRKYDWSGNLIWRVECEHSPKISPRSDFSGVWLYGPDEVKTIDLNGSVKTFISEPGNMFLGVFEDDRFVYILDVNAKIRRFSKTGQPMGTVYETTEMLGLTWLTGGTSETTAPYHVFR
jgi:uncharacterized protein YutD